MKNTKFILILLCLIFSFTAYTQDIEIKQTPISIGALASGPVDEDNPLKVGKIYNIYTQDDEIYVAIQYSENDFGMFKALDIKIHEENNENK